MRSNESARARFRTRWRCLQKYDPETGRQRPRCREQLSDSPGPAPNLAAPARQERPPPRRPYPELILASGARLSKGARFCASLCWKARIPRQHLKYFVQSGDFTRHFAPRAQRLMRSNTLIIVSLDDQIVNLLQAQVPAASAVNSSAGSGFFGFPVFEVRRCRFSPWGVAFQCFINTFHERYQAPV